MQTKSAGYSRVEENLKTVRAEDWLCRGGARKYRKFMRKMHKENNVRCMFGAGTDCNMCNYLDNNIYYTL